jgi:hypothetical protein
VFIIIIIAASQSTKNTPIKCERATWVEKKNYGRKSRMNL